MSDSKITGVKSQNIYDLKIAGITVKDLLAAYKQVHGELPDPGYEDRTASPGNTTYYVDPVNGDDGHAGIDRELAWRSFVLVNRLLLAAGDRVEIISPGSFDHTLALTGSGTAEAPVTVCFAPGRYDFHPGNALRRRYNISNANDDADGDKAIGILLEGARHFTISGNGARIFYRGKMIEVCIDSSDYITVFDLQFDYHRPTVSEFTVVSVAYDYADLSIHEDSRYTIEDNSLIWEGEGWRHGIARAQQLDLDSNRVWRCDDPLDGMQIEELSPFLVRARGKHGMTENRVFQIRQVLRDCAGVFVRSSKDITFNHVDFFFLHGLGIICQFTENITLDSVSIALDEDSGRTCVSSTGVRIGKSG